MARRIAFLSIVMLVFPALPSTATPVMARADLECCSIALDVSDSIGLPLGYME